MKIRKLEITEVFSLLAKNPNQLFYTNESEYGNIEEMHRDITGLFTFRVKGQVGITTTLYIKEEFKTRQMTRFEAMKKAGELSAESAKLTGEIWLVTCKGWDYCNPLVFRYIDYDDTYRFAKFDMQGNKLTKDFKFEVSDE